MLSAGDYELLARLSLAMKEKSAQNRIGSRRSVQKGTSAEFSDFRAYLPGDDLRRLDWNMYARSDRMYIREYLEEREAVVTVFLDTSASMDYGKCPKAELAGDLCEIVSFLALNHLDRVVLYDLGRMEEPLTLSGGKQAVFRVKDWLSRRVYEGEGSSFSAVQKWSPKGAGITVVISDFLAPELVDETDESFERMLRYLRYGKQRPVLLQTLCGEELRVTMEGTKNLIDQETGEKLRVTMRADTIARYEEALRLLKERLSHAAAQAGGVFVCCDSEKERRQLIMEDLRELYAV